jgi:hypothetical protein
MRWEPLAPNGNIQMVKTHGAWKVTELCDRTRPVRSDSATGRVLCDRTLRTDAPCAPCSKSGQCTEIRMKGVMAILALGSTKGVCGWPWLMLGTLGT